MMTAAEISSLREYVSHEHPVVSLYLDVDGARYPRRSDWEAEFSFLVHDARRRAVERLRLSSDQQEALDAELQRIGEFLALEFERDNARGLVLFSCRAEDLWRVVPLTMPVENSLMVDWKPRMAPLMENLAAYRNYLVLVTNREMARIFESHYGDINERSDILDAVLKHHEQGGWEQNKLQRRSDKQAHEHLKKSAEVVFELFMGNGYERFAAGTPDALWPELDSVLHPYLKQRLAAHFQAEPSANINEIHASLLDIEVREREIQVSAMLESLGPELESGKSWVAGFDDVLAALNDKRVDVLVTEAGQQVEGYYCASCRSLSFSEQSCPGCRQQMPNVDDLIAEARESALRQDAELISVATGNPMLEAAGRIAAHVRF